MCDQELQHLVHGTHEEDQPQLGHRHGDEAPQEDRRAHRMTEWYWTWGERQKVWQQPLVQVGTHAVRMQPHCHSLLGVRSHSKPPEHTIKKRLWSFDLIFSQYFTVYPILEDLHYDVLLTHETSEVHQFIRVPLVQYLNFLYINRGWVSLVCQTPALCV